MGAVDKGGQSAGSDDSGEAGVFCPVCEMTFAK